MKKTKKIAILVQNFDRSNNNRESSKEKPNISSFLILKNEQKLAHKIE